MNIQKKYYWLKLKNDFFKNPKMKKLRKIAGGDTYTIIYLKLMLLVVENNGILEYEGIEKSIEEELALKLDEDDMNVKVLFGFLQSQNLIEEVKDNCFLLSEVVASIGSESSSAERVRKHRELGKENQKMLHCNSIVTNSNENVTTELRVKKEEEEEEQIKEFAKWLPKKGAVKNFELFLEKIKNNIRNGDKKTLKNFEVFKKSNLELKQNPINAENKAVERLQTLKNFYNSKSPNELLQIEETGAYLQIFDKVTVNFINKNMGLVALKQRIVLDSFPEHTLAELGGAA